MRLTGVSDAEFVVALERAKRMNELEDSIALEWYGVTWEYLDYDDRDLVTCEAYDRFNG